MTGSGERADGVVSAGVTAGMTAGAPGIHRSCVEILRAWQPPTADQQMLRAGYLDHLAGHPDGWSRRCAGAHVTASSLICVAGSGQVLLTLHARIGRWLQTGGHIEDADADLPTAALREATEESGLTGLEIAPVPLLLSRHEVPCGAVRPTYHLDVQFLVLADAARPLVMGAESLDLRWFSHDRLPEADSSVRALVAAAARRLGW